MSLVARLTLGLAGAAAALPLPAALDAAAARGAIRAIGLYRRHLSRHSGRRCLFHPSCSRRAAALLAAHGWRTGMPLVRDQVRRCGGDYTLVSLGGGRVALVTCDGMRFEGDELAGYPSGGERAGACSSPRPGQCSGGHRP